MCINNHDISFLCNSPFLKTIDQYILLYSSMEGKKKAGCQRIPLEKIEKKVARYASFFKRRLCLYKKASELIQERDVDIGVFISSQTGKPYSFVHQTANVVINHFKSPTTIDLGAQFAGAEARNNVIQMNDMLNDFDAREKVTKNHI